MPVGGDVVQLAVLHDVVKRMEELGRIVNRTESRVATMSKTLLLQIRDEVNLAIGESQVETGQEGALPKVHPRPRRRRNKESIKKTIGEKAQWNLLAVCLSPC